MKYKYLLLDWDGCLADTLSVWMDAYVSTFNKYGLFPTEEEIVNTTFGSYRGPIELGISENQLDDFMKETFANVTKNVGNVRLYSGVKKTLDRLKGKVRLCVLTSSERELFEKALDRNMLKDYFEFSICSKDVRKHKPDPEIIYLAVEKFGGTLKDTLIVGDSDKDVIAGHNASVDSVVVYPTINHRFYKKDDLLSLKPTYFIEEFTMLERIVLR